MLAGPKIGHREVLLDRHVRCRTHQRILEEAADVAAADMLRNEGDVLSVELDVTGVGVEAPGDGIEQRRLAGAVRTDDRGEITILEGEAQIRDGTLFIDGACIEGFKDMFDFQHLIYLPAWTCVHGSRSSAYA